ncbi:hypothetical protein [Stieleria varia]|uniref:hypothetical protein n=1 Tax=Stieleria varia TaxID=2528005 RepID=UPI0011B3AE87|nr:hypothetical protein [Stieleria varia]
MIKSTHHHFIFAALVTLVAVSQAQAELVLELGNDGSATLRNRGMLDIDFDAYSIKCADGCLSVTSWNSIEDQLASDSARVVNEYGVGALGFSEFNSTPNQLSEFTVSSGAILEPNESLSLGTPILLAMNLSEAVANGTFSWDWSSATSGLTMNAPITVAAVPEPSACSACVICMAIIATQRRCKRTRSP